MKRLNFLLVFSCLGLCSLSAFAETREFNVNAVEMSNAKFWLPSSFTAKKGDTLLFHLKSKIKGKNNIHGFSIKDYGIEVLVDDQGVVKSKDPKNNGDVKFVADKVGIFEVRCHLHPGHVGGQLVVME